MSLRTLGLDVGNGKVKCCLIDWQGHWQKSQIAWDSLPLPLSSNRRQDFALGVPVQIYHFLDEQGVELEQLERVVVCCSQSFSYQPYSESIRHLAEILALFGDVPTSLIRADGLSMPWQQLLELAEQELYAYTFTNFYGSALLGSRLIRQGLSLDLGTTTLDIIPIVAGQIDPAGLAPPANPADYLRFRYTQSRIHWLGLTTVPLCMLASRVPLGAEVYQVVPRSYRSDLLFGMDPAHPELLTRHAYGRHFPDPLTCRQHLAQFIGVDDSLVSPAEIEQVRDFLYEQLVERVAVELKSVAESVFDCPLSQLEIASFALGEELLLKPALLRAGFALEQVRTLNLRRDLALWSASSAFAMALLALEAQLGEVIGIGHD